MRRKLFHAGRFFCVVAFCLLFRSIAFACSCGPTPTVLDSFESSNIVATMRFVDVESRESYGGIKSVRLEVTKVYKGDVAAGKILSFAQGGGSDCIWTWNDAKAGNEYLFYLGKPSKGHPFFGGENAASDDPLLYYVIGCGRSTSLKGAEDDLNYLNNLDRLSGKTRLSGTFSSWIAESKDFANVTLQVVGKGTSYALRTDKNGFYELYGLPPGEYVVKPRLPFGWKYNDYMIAQSPSITRGSPYDRFEYARNGGIPITVKQGRHASLDVWFEHSAQISGIVLGLDGKPVKDASVKAVSTELKEGDYRGHSDYTDEQGRFVIDELDTDRYRLVIDNANELIPNGNTNSIFFPSTTSYQDAAIISVSLGGKIKGLIFKLPKKLQTLTVSGRLFYSDGRAVPGGIVKFVPDDKNLVTQTRETDADGNFKFGIKYGTPGRLFGDLTTFAGEFENCPAADSLVAGRSGKVDLHSNDAYLTATQFVTELTLEFPFPFCVKRK